MKRRRDGRSTRHRLSREDRARLQRRVIRDRKASRSSRRTSSPSPATIRIAGGAAGVIVVVLILAQLLGGERGGMTREDPAGPDSGAWMEEVEARAREHALGLGLREAWIISHPPGSPEGDSTVTVIEFRVPGNMHMEVLNLALTRAVEMVGGAVVRGIELNDARVELEIAWHGRRTHRFVLQRYSGYTRHVGRIGIVIDDFGRVSQAMLSDFAGLGVPWTATVIPGTPNSAGQAGYLTARGIQVLIHMPMEPEAGEEWDLGNGAIYMETPREEVTDLIGSALDEVPGAVGLNNHMGSRVTRDTPIMRAVMADLRERGLFFLDSRTTGASIAADEAERAGIPWAARDVFLDPEDEVNIIEEQFRQALVLARRNGSAIMIGHPRTRTLQTLQRLIPAARQAGYEFVTVDRLLRRSGRQ